MDQMICVWSCSFFMSQFMRQSMFLSYLCKVECADCENASRACLKNHSRNLHAPLCGIFHPNSVAVARYGDLIRAKSPTNCDVHLAESLFQTRSRAVQLLSEVLVQIGKHSRIMKTTKNTIITRREMFL